MRHTPEPAINPTAWAELRALGGDEADAMVAELIGMYQEDAAGLVATIRAAAAAGDAPGLADATHALRSPSATLGALPLAECCRLVELAARSEGLASAERIEPLLTEFERVRAALAQLALAP
ncbi:Hpt domain-containing protein [Synechococcus sp. ATX 2A4]|uniref:Hpt domain-containing protein n=1 Tax=Synechococcus sp. ATX 2A4 TaxID=2823727 RepID=UPI0020CF9A35|nr:Hpt domain-containing protein [Synechococcus sp. ATX 2A4]MCP9884016.1 Hpt domain-containing protein [Synechococcus sp. ATX 2A4]